MNIQNVSLGVIYERKCEAKLVDKWNNISENDLF